MPLCSARQQPVLQFVSSLSTRDQTWLVFLHPQVLTGGFFVIHMPAWIAWFKWLSYICEWSLCLPHLMTCACLGCVGGWREGPGSCEQALQAGKVPCHRSP